MLHRVTAKLREWQARRKKYNRILASSKQRLEDLIAAHDEARRELDEQLRIIKRRRERDAPQPKIDRTADRIEHLRSVVDQLLEKMDARREKNQRVMDILRHSAERVQALRAKRRRLLTEAEGKIGRYWHIREFDCNDGTDCPDYMTGPLDDLAARVLDKMRDKYGAGHVNSGYRTVSWNQHVGGEPNSYHVYPIRKSQPAADCTFATGTPSQWAAFARSLGVGGVGQYASFVHVDTGPRRDWWG